MLESKLNVGDSSSIAQLTSWQDTSFAFSFSIERVGKIIYCWSLVSFQESCRVFSLILLLLKIVGLLGTGLKE